MTKNKSITGELMITFFKIGLSGLKSFVYALSQIVWVFTGVFLLSAGFIYLIKSGDIKTITEVPKELINLINIFKNYWHCLFLAIWSYELIINFKELENKTK